MNKRIERITEVDEVAAHDIILFSYAGKLERYMVDKVDENGLTVSSLSNKETSIRIFPKSHLVNDNWYIEKEPNFSQIYHGF